MPRGWHGGAWSEVWYAAESVCSVASSILAGGIRLEKGRPSSRATRSQPTHVLRESESGFISIDYPGVYSPLPDMDLGADWPIAILATQDVACGVRLWRTSGQQRATVVVKATFSLVDGGPMRLVGPEPILVNDQHLAGNQASSVIVPSDLSPYMPRADVILSGHAQAPSGAPATQLKVRLAVAGQRPLVDKSVIVHGERVLLEDGSASQAVPFTRVPLLYERAVRSSGTDENPVGMTPAVGAPLPNIVDPSDPSEPAGLGAIASTWPARCSRSSAWVVSCSASSCGRRAASRSAR